MVVLKLLFSCEPSAFKQIWLLVRTEAVNLLARLAAAEGEKIIRYVRLKITQTKKKQKTQHCANAMLKSCISVRINVAK